jgi:hypothetical protein
MKTMSPTLIALFIFTILFSNNSLAQSRQSSGNFKITPYPEQRIQGKGNFLIIKKNPQDTLEYEKLIMKGKLYDRGAFADGKLYKDQDILAFQNKKGFFMRRLIKMKRKGPVYGGYLQRVHSTKLLDEYRSIWPDQINPTPARASISIKIWNVWLNQPGTQKVFLISDRKALQVALKECAECSKKLRSPLANTTRIVKQYFEGKLK